MFENYECKIDLPHHFHAKHTSGLQIKSLDADGVFAGYASVFNLVDSQRDMILPGAFTETVRGRTPQIKLLWQHDQREPIGIIEELREDENGLFIRGRLMLEIARAREAYSLLKEGAISGLSIGYTPKQYRTDPDSGIRILSALDLWEVSLVTFPANHAAQVTVVKGRDLDELEMPGELLRLSHELERACRILMN